MWLQKWFDHFFFTLRAANRSWNNLGTIYLTSQAARLSKDCKGLQLAGKTAKIEGFQGREKFCNFPDFRGLQVSLIACFLFLGFMGF